MIVATMVICLLSFVVWLHHFFTMGAGADVNGFFGITTMIIAGADGGEGLQLAVHDVRRAHPLRDADAVGGRLHGDVRDRGDDRRAARGAARRFRAAQFAFPRRAFPQRRDRRRAVRRLCWLCLLVPQGIRLPARRILGQMGVLAMDRRLLPRLHAALRAGPDGHDAAVAALRRPRLASHGWSRPRAARR